MAKYHINSKGEPGKCTAQAGKCPFGGEANHYASPAKAQQAYELSMAAEALPSARRKAYPEEGDSVVIGRGAGVWANELEAYEGTQGEVVAFNGTTYTVAFPDGQELKFNHQFINFAPEPPK